MIIKNRYDLLCDFIFEKLRFNDYVTLTELLEDAEEYLMGRIKENLLWSLLQVKQDLVVRGLIIISFQRNRVQVISLKKTVRKKLYVAGEFIKSRASTGK